jgi:hypothetical protein
MEMNLKESLEKLWDRDVRASIELFELGKVLEATRLRHDEVQVSLGLFELGERIRRNPRALSNRPPSEWVLPLDIEALYDEQWYLAQAIMVLTDEVIEREVSESGEVSAAGRRLLRLEGDVPSKEQIIRAVTEFMNGEANLPGQCPGSNR